MTEHLPECSYEKTVEYDDGSADVCDECICDQIRACERRVLDAARETIMELSPRLSISKFDGGYNCCGCSTLDDLLFDCVAAIDSLRGESNE